MLDKYFLILLSVFHIDVNLFEDFEFKMSKCGRNIRKHSFFMKAFKCYCSIYDVYFVVMMAYQWKEKKTFAGAEYHGKCKTTSSRFPRCLVC